MGDGRRGAAGDGRQSAGQIPLAKSMNALTGACRPQSAEVAGQTRAGRATPCDSRALWQNRKKNRGTHAYRRDTIDVTKLRISVRMIFALLRLAIAL